MEIEDMQQVWKSQKQDDLFSIDREALYATVRRKSRSTERLLLFVELMMILVNLVVGILLFFDGVEDGNSTISFLIPIFYIGFSLFAVYRRLRRRRIQTRFAETLLGDLDRAIWQMDYLIRQGRDLIVWYLVPLVLLVALVMIIDGGSMWVLGALGLALLVGYFGGRWEIRRFHAPRKRELEDLRRQLSEEPR